MGRMGAGLRATRRFEKGEFVIEYAGEHIDCEQEAIERRELLKESGRDVYLMQFQVANGKYKWLVCISSSCDSLKKFELMMLATSNFYHFY